MHHVFKNFSRPRALVAGLLALLLCVSALPGQGRFGRGLSRRAALAPLFSRARTNGDRMLSVLIDRRSMFGAIERLCAFAPRQLAEDRILREVLVSVMSDFYWTRIIALARIKQYLALNDGVSAGLKTMRIMDCAQEMAFPPAADRELRHLLFLVSGIDHEAIKRQANAIVMDEVKMVVNFVRDELEDSDPDALPKFLARREEAGSRIVERLGSELLRGLDYPAAQWEDFAMDKAAIGGGENFSVMRPIYSGGVRKLPAAVNWQIISDMLYMEKRLVRKKDEDDVFASMLETLGDYSIFDRLIGHYQTLLSDFLKTNPGQAQIDYFLTGLSTVLAFHPLNSVEKGRVGAILVAPDPKLGLKILGLGFDGAPARMQSDRNIMGRELWTDRYVPRRRKDRNAPDFRFLFILRRSPCAEKKALMQALSQMDRGNISPEAIADATIYTSRTPCYQCVLALSQMGVGSVSAGDYQERDVPSRRVDQACAFVHSSPKRGFPADKNSVLGYDFDSLAELSRLARVVNIVRAFSPSASGVRAMLSTQNKRFPEREFVDVWDFDTVMRLIADVRGAIGMNDLFRSSRYKAVLAQPTRYEMFLNALYDYTYRIRQELDAQAIERERAESFAIAA